MEPKTGLTCWPLDAIGVDLDGQNQEKRAGVHRVVVLVPFQRAGVTISFRLGPAVRGEEPSPSAPLSSH